MRDRLAGRDFAAHPERLEVSGRAARGEVPHVVDVVVRRVPEHDGELVEHLVLHRRGGATRIDRVVVGVQLHRCEVGGDRDGVRWLEHLPGVLRVKVRKVIVEALDELTEHGLHMVDIDVLAGMDIPLAIAVFEGLDALDRLR